MRTCALAWLAALPLPVLAGCGAFPQDQRGTETVCTVHGVALREDTVEVHNDYEGTVIEPDDVREAGMKFPYARVWAYADQSLGWPARARVLYCPQCRAEREVWLKSWHRTPVEAEPGAEASGY